MVWGMVLPSDFGEFFPDGEFEYDPSTKDSGWLDRLRLHYLAQSGDEQIRLFDYRKFDHGGNGVGYGAGEYPSYVWGKFTHGIGVKGKPDQPQFCPAEALEAPTSFDMEKAYGRLGSLIMLNGRTLAVDEALKGILERLESEVHQFFPIQITMPKGELFPKNYFMIVIGSYKSSFSAEKSKPGSFKSYPKYPGFYNLDESKKGISGLAFSKAQIGNGHLWREFAFRETLTCLSDALMNEINALGLRIPSHFQAKEF